MTVPAEVEAVGAVARHVSSSSNFISSTTPGLMSSRSSAKGKRRYKQKVKEDIASLIYDDHD